MNSRFIRLQASRDHIFSGRQIDRSRPLTFSLDGREVTGFAGDTVLSAILAAGIDTAGTRQGSPLALGEQFAPAVAEARLAHDPGRVLPMERVRAWDGAELVTIGPRGDHNTPGLLRRLGSLLAKNSPTSLGLALDSDVASCWPWLDLPVTQTIEADIAIIGGGVAGMAAAQTAAKSGARVVLIERRPVLGGDSAFFGALEGEPEPLHFTSHLAGPLAAMDNVTVLTACNVLGLWRGCATAHRVLDLDGSPASIIVDVIAPRFIIAAGAGDRLPVFAGNRLPGVTSAVAAFQRAIQYGVLPSGRILFSTAVNEAYRFVLSALNAGANIGELLDMRLDPRSRFIEFTKAFGHAPVPGMVPLMINRQDDGSLQSHFGLAADEDRPVGAPRLSSSVIVSAGWQPALALWQLAGGRIGWQRETVRFVAEGVLEGVAVAGACAGYRTMTACAESGKVTARALFGRAAGEIKDPVIEAIYESPDAPLRIAPIPPGATVPAYLDGGVSLATTVAPPAAKRRPSLFGPRNVDVDGWTNEPHALSLGDIAAKTALGEFAGDLAAEIAGERCIVPRRLIATTSKTPSIGSRAAKSLPVVPGFLAGRFKGKTAVWRAASEDGRRFETGCLIFASSEQSAPADAIGVVLRRAEAGSQEAIILVSGQAHKPGKRIVVHDAGAGHLARLVARQNGQT